MIENLHLKDFYIRITNNEDALRQLCKALQLDAARDDSFFFLEIDTDYAVSETVLNVSINARIVIPSGQQDLVQSDTESIIASVNKLLTKQYISGDKQYYKNTRKLLRDNGWRLQYKKKQIRVSTPPMPGKRGYLVKHSDPAFLSKIDITKGLLSMTNRNGHTFSGPVPKDEMSFCFMLADLSIKYSDFFDENQDVSSNFDFNGKAFQNLWKRIKYSSVKSPCLSPHLRRYSNQLSFMFIEPKIKSPLLNTNIMTGSHVKRHTKSKQDGECTKYKSH